jgi:hypothetical protein
MLHILEDIDERFACIRRRDRMLLVVRLYIELRLAGAAAATRRSRLRRILRQDRETENRQDAGRENSFHHGCMTQFGAKWFPSMPFD